MSELVKGKASYHKTLLHDAYIQMTVSPKAGFIRVREMSGKLTFFQGQGIVRELYVVSGKMKFC